MQVQDGGDLILEQVIERDWIAEHVTADQDVVHEILAQEADYLAAVQVGLRLARQRGNPDGRRRPTREHHQ